MARNDRTIRLETVKQALASARRGVSLKALAERHGWALRNVYRDVQVLEASGFNVIRDEGRVRIEDAGRSTFGAVTPEERLALFVAREQARGWRETSLGRALDTLWNRVSTTGDGQAALLPIDSLPWLTVREWSGVDYRRHRRIVETLERSVRERVVIQAVYRAAGSGETTHRLIEPGELRWDPGLETLYVIAWCRLRGDVRIFAAHRFLAASLLDERFSPRPETRSKSALKNAFRIWRSGHVHAVRIWFAAEVAHEIRERRWLPAQRVEEAEGGAVVTGEVSGLEEVQRWVLGYGARARVLEPPDLVEAVRGQLAAGVGRYLRAATAKRTRRVAARAG